MPTVVERQASRRPAEGTLRHVAACGRKDESHTEGPKKKCIRMGLLLASSGEAIRLCQIDCREGRWRAGKRRDRATPSSRDRSLGARQGTRDQGNQRARVTCGKIRGTLQLLAWWHVSGEPIDGSLEHIRG